MRHPARQPGIPFWVNAPFFFGFWVGPCGVGALVWAGTCLGRATNLSDLVSEETRRRSAVGEVYQWTENLPSGEPSVLGWEDLRFIYY